MLLKTDLQNVDSSFIRLPFQSIYISVPKNSFKLTAEQKHFYVEGFYIHEVNLATFKRDQVIKELGKGITKFTRILTVLAPVGSEAPLQLRTTTTSLSIYDLNVATYLNSWKRTISEQD